MAEPRPRLALLCPGQGAVPEVAPAQLFAAHPEVGRSYASLASQGCPEWKELRREDIRHDLQAQLGTFTLSLALANTLAKAGCRPGLVAGYSCGVYAGWVAAGGCPAEDGARLVRRAYELLTDQDPRAPWRMAAVLGLDLASLESLLAGLGSPGHVSLVHNRTQAIVSVAAAELAAFAAACLARGALKVVPLPFGRAYHVPWLQPAGDALAAWCAGLETSRATAPMVLGSDPRLVREPHQAGQAIARQLWRPVRWDLTVDCLLRSGAEVLVSLDTTRALDRTVGWLTRATPVMGVADSRDLDRLLERWSSPDGGLSTQAMALEPVAERP